MSPSAISQLLPPLTCWMRTGDSGNTSGSRSVRSFGTRSSIRWPLPTYSRRSGWSAAPGTGRHPHPPLPSAARQPESGTNEVSATSHRVLRVMFGIGLQRHQRRVADLAFHELAVLVDRGDVDLPVAVLVLFAAREEGLSLLRVVGLEHVGAAIAAGVAFDPRGVLLVLDELVVGPLVHAPVVVAILLELGALAILVLHDEIDLPVVVAVVALLHQRVALIHVECVARAVVVAVDLARRHAPVAVHL